eukprot:SAG11_NODE_3085_length_2705_cov_2.939754_2_plen_277_part_00
MPAALTAAVVHMLQLAICSRLHLLLSRIGLAKDECTSCWQRCLPFLPSADVPAVHDMLDSSTDEELDVAQTRDAEEEVAGTKVGPEDLMESGMESISMIRPTKTAQTSIDDIFGVAGNLLISTSGTGSSDSKDSDREKVMVVGAEEAGVPKSTDMSPAARSDGSGEDDITHYRVRASRKRRYLDVASGTTNRPRFGLVHSVTTNLCFGRTSRGAIMQHRPTTSAAPTARLMHNWKRCGQRGGAARSGVVVSESDLHFIARTEAPKSSVDAIFSMLS